MPEASSREVTMFEIFLTTFLSVTRSGFAGAGSLLSVHLGDKAAEVGRGLGRQPVDPVPQSLFADGADLIHGNFSFPARALDLQPATPLRMQ